MTGTIVAPITPNFSDSKQPKYIVLIQSLRAAIRSGTLPKGYRMPAVRDLAWQLGVTPGTVARAYKMAAEEGLVETAVGRGTFVSDVAPAAQARPPEPLIAHPPAGMMDMRAVRVPDVGQDALIRTAMRRVAGANEGGFRDYPTDDSSRPAREAVARWIGTVRAGRFEAQDVVLGLGAQHSVMTALQACLHGPSPVILTEELAYPGVRHAARLLRAQLVGVAMDADGLRPDALEEALQRHGGQVLLTAAEAHSPTTLRTGLERRRQIAEIARRYQVQIIEDDCHCIARPDTPAYRAIVPEHAWYVSSLTKSVSAALRFGFAIAPRGQTAMAAQVAQSSFYAMPQPILDLCAELLNSGAAEQVRKMVVEETGARVRLAVNAVGGWDLSWRADLPFVWLRLPRGWRGSTFARDCAVAGVRIKSADEFALPDGQAPNAVRLSLTADAPKPEISRALSRLSDLLTRPPAAVDI